MEKPTVNKYPPSELKQMSFNNLFHYFKDSASPSDIMTSSYMSGDMSTKGNKLEVSEATVKSWLYTSKKPGPTNWNIFCLFIKDHCSNYDISEAWINALSTLRESDKIKNVAEKMTVNCADVENNQTEIQPNDDKIKEDKEKISQKDWLTSDLAKLFTIFRHFFNCYKAYCYSLVIILSITIILVLFLIPSEKNIAAPDANQLELAPAVLQIQNEDNKKRDKLNKSGLLMDVYLFQKKHRQLPVQPTGISLATLVHPNAGRFTFVDHYAVESVASATQDRDMGLYYSGFINTTQSGEHLFSIDYQSGVHIANQIFKKCRSVVTINEETVFNILENVGRGEHVSRQKSLLLPKGNNKLSIWFTCNNLRSLTPKWDYDTYKDTVLTLNVKRPNGNMITVMSQSELTH